MERRLFERISLPIKFKYEVRTRPKIVKESTSKNISGGGICLSLNEKLLPSTRLSINVQMGEGKNTITLNGKVIWTRKVEVADGGRTFEYYNTGIEFINADPINIDKIISCFQGQSF
jgi:c-di-GMP-binding flagellar brake protein YcgR